MNNDYTSLPPRELVAELAAEMPPKVNLRDYYYPLSSLRKKGYTFREIAEWISKILGVEINRNQVVYLLTTDPMVQDMEAEEEHAEREYDRLEEIVPGVMQPSAAPSDQPTTPAILTAPAKDISPKKARRTRKNVKK